MLRNSATKISGFGLFDYLCHEIHHTTPESSLVRVLCQNFSPKNSSKMTLRIQIIAVLRKYSAVLRIALANSMQYRLNFVSNVSLSLLVGAAVQMFLWKAVYSSTAHFSIAGMNVDQMLLYIACASICTTIAARGGNTERNAADEIRNGDLNKYLVKPVSHSTYTLASALAERLVSLVVVLATAILVGLPLAHNAGISLPFSGILIALVLLLFGVCINFYMSMIISYLAFWVDEVWTFHVVKDISMWFLAGQLLPLSALPESVRKVSELLPFQYLGYVPTQFMTGTFQPSDAGIYFVGASVWLAILVGITWLVWQKGMKKYGAFGG